jgi:hypothetical protein
LGIGGDVAVSVVMPVRRLADGQKAVGRLPSGAMEVVLVTGPGLAGAKNYGAGVARGDLLIFTDDDVQVQGDLGWFDGRPAEELFWGAEVLDGTGGQAAANVFGMAMMRGNFLGVNAAFQAVRREAFELVGGYRRGSIYEDVDLGRRLLAIGVRPCRSPVRVRVMRRYAGVGEVTRWRSGEALYGRSGPYEARRLVSAKDS